MSPTSGPNSLYSGCPGDIVFTCQANRLSTVFWWINSDTTPIARYSALGMNYSMLNITTTDSIQFGLVILVTNVVRHNPIVYNYTSIACTSTRDIVESNISKIWCGKSLLNTSIFISTYPDGNT